MAGKGEQPQLSGEMRKQAFQTKMASAVGGSGGSEDDDGQQSLIEFVHTHPFPQSVSVAGGGFLSRDVTIARGDVLILRGKAPTSITLSFHDEDTGTMQECTVSPDIPTQFLVLPPKDSVQADRDSHGAKAGGGRPLSMVTYPTVADLLLDCPTFFEANSTYDDPYLPGFSVNPGDRFYYVKVVKDVAADKLERLQCRTDSGELVCLSTRCKGNFTVLRDDTPYTLRQLIDLAKVPRRLKLLSQNDLIKQAEKLGTEAKIPEKLLSCSGVITMSCPQEMLEVSPWDNPQAVCCVPVDSNLHVRLFSDSDYEEPVTNRRIRPEPMSTFAQEHEDEFPVQATLMSYVKPPDIISLNLSRSREMIIHEKLHTQKLFVKDSKKDDFFAIDESVQISFVQIPRTLSSVFEMMTLPLGSQVRVLADVAADFPEPFILRYGDVLCVTKHNSSSWKFKHSNTGDVPIAKCERLVQGKKPEKMKLPLDLEVNLVLVEDGTQLKVTKISDIFSGEDQIPGGDVSVVEGNGASYPPLPASLQILEVLTDSELIVSPLRTTTAISPLIKTCVRIPVRHEVELGFKRKLEFPEGYFVLPSRDKVVSLGIERVQESEYEELVQARKVATEYEEMTFSSRRESEDDTRSQASSMGRSRHAVNQEIIPRSTSSGTLERKRHRDRMKRISQAFNPKNWHWSRRKDSDEEVQHPVSGLLTLALQPSRAVSNDYMEDCGPEAGNVSPTAASGSQATEPEGPPDDTYEDVDITYPPAQARASRSHAAVVGAASYDGKTCASEKRGEDSTENHARRRRRRKSDPGLRMLVRTQQPTKPVSPEGRTKPSGTRRVVEQPNIDLERAPIHHTRTRSSDVSEKSSRNLVEDQQKRSHSDRQRETHSPNNSSAESQQKNEHLDRNKSERTESAHPDRLRTRESPELDSFTKPKSLEPEPPRRNKSSDVGKYKKHRSHDSPQLRETNSPDSDHRRQTHQSDHSKKPKSPDLDQFTTRRNVKQSSPPSRSEKSKTGDSPTLSDMGTFPEDVCSPRDQSDRSEQERKQRTETAPSVDSPQRPRRPRRKKDDEVMNRSVDSLDDRECSSTPEAPKRERGAQVKPAIPPKPVLAPSPRASEPVGKPMAPPRKRGGRIGSTEAEQFGGGNTSKAVQGRKRLS